MIFFKHFIFKIRFTKALPLKVLCTITVYSVYLYIVGSVLKRPYYKYINWIFLNLYNNKKNSAEQIAMIQIFHFYESVKQINFSLNLQICLGFTNASWYLVKSDFKWGITHVESYLFSLNFNFRREAFSST